MIDTPPRPGSRPPALNLQKIVWPLLSFFKLYYYVAVGLYYFCIRTCTSSRLPSSSIYCQYQHCHGDCTVLQWIAATFRYSIASSKKIQCRCQRSLYVKAFCFFSSVHLYLEPNVLFRWSLPVRIPLLQGFKFSFLILDYIYHHRIEIWSFQNHSYKSVSFQQNLINFVPCESVLSFSIQSAYEPLSKLQIFPSHPQIQLYPARYLLIMYPNI